MSSHHDSRNNATPSTLAFGDDNHSANSTALEAASTTSACTTQSSGAPVFHQGVIQPAATPNPSTQDYPSQGCGSSPGAVDGISVGEMSAIQSNVSQESGMIRNNDRQQPHRRIPDGISVEGSLDNAVQATTRSDLKICSQHTPWMRKRRNERSKISPKVHVRRRGSGSELPLSAPTQGSAWPRKRQFCSIRRRVASSAPTEETGRIDGSTDHQNLNVTCRSMSSYRVVQLLYQSDVELFDAIQEWKSNHPTLWVDDAIDAFASARGADALAQLVYSTEAFDMVLEYNTSHEDLDSIFDTNCSRSSLDHLASPLPKRQQGSPVTVPMDTTLDQSYQHLHRKHRSWLSQIRRIADGSVGAGNQETQTQYFSKSELRERKLRSHRQNFQLSLLHEGMFLELEKSINSDAVYVKVLAPFWRLAIEAQRTNCKADLADTILPSIPYASRMFPSITKLFPCLNQGLEQRREAVLFKASHLHDFHLAEPGRRWSDVVRHSGAVGKDGFHVGSKCGSDGRLGFFQTSRRGYLVNSMMMRTVPHKLNGRKMGLRSSLRYGVYQKLYALHDGSFKHHSAPLRDLNYRAQLHIKWARRFWTSQPLDMVNAYLGERIGIYFAWFGHYTKWLTVPAAVGMAVFVYGIVNAASLKKLDATPNALFAIFDNALTMPYALFMSIWSTVYIEFWKRANQHYAFRWNMNDYERVELPRTEFRATKVRVSPVTGKRELYYPTYWRVLRIFASSIAVLIAVAVVVGCVACLMIFKTWCRHHIGGIYATTVATAVLNLVVIIILGEIWCRLAEWLTDKENHKYTNNYEDSLIIKRYLFDFTNMYGTLFYYAFFKAPFGARVFKDRLDLQDTCQYDACITELTVQLAVVFIGKQFLNGLFEMVLPKEILADKALKRRRFLEARKRTRAPQWVKDDDLPSYEGRILKCYRKAVIQFGFCTLFVTSFPVAPAFALINNLIDIRMEAYRLLTQYRRPVALRAKDIGMWERVMEFISFTSVITNAAIIAFSSLWIKQNLFVKILHATEDGELLAARLGFILVFEHVVYLFKYILRLAIPSVPLTIKLAVERSKYMTRAANEGSDSGIDSDVIDLDDAMTDNDSCSYIGQVSDTESRDPEPKGVQESQRNRNNDTEHLGESESSNTGIPHHRLARAGRKLQHLWTEKIMRNKDPSKRRDGERRIQKQTSRSRRSEPLPDISVASLESGSHGLKSHIDEPSLRSLTQRPSFTPLD
ncbi:calcium-activated chloride channel-domain-containing protein [Mortierella sp. GBAus27b]|nr:calcium-activated chloride channel-domain-containing protein [Mortierella sp. GBAus27b]